MRFGSVGFGVVLCVVGSSAMAELSVTSPSFQSGGDIPKLHACAAKGGENTSIPLAWSGASEAVSSYAVVMDDEVAPCRKGDGACRHWGVYNLPKTVSSLEPNHPMASITGVALGRSYSGREGYDGMCPPGPHVYTISVYALKGGMPLLQTGVALTRSQFESQYQAYILDKGSLVGNFSPW